MRHGSDGAGKLAQLVPVDRILLGRGRVIGLIKLLQIFDSVYRYNSRTTDMTCNDRAGHLKKVSPRVDDGIDALHLGQNRIGLLNDIIRIDTRQGTP